MKVTDHQKVKYVGNFWETLKKNIFGDQGNMQQNFWEQRNLTREFWETLKNISGDRGNMQQNFWEQRNLTRVNLREHLNLL